MPNIVFVIFLEIIVTIQASNPRSVNVALETVLQFDGKDDIGFIDTMQSFLNKLKTTITRHRATNDQDGERLAEDNKDIKKQFVFTDFLGETVTVLKSFQDDDLKKFFNILEREIETWHTRKELHEISSNPGFRRLIDRNLQRLKNSPVSEIRRKLNVLSDKLNFRNRNGNNGFVADFLNHFYKKESEANLMNFLNNLKLYRSETRRNDVAYMRKIIRDGILTIIEPFLKLNSNTIRSINKIYYKYIANNSNTNDGLMKRVKTYKKKSKRTREKHKTHDVLSENQILDYIEDHLKVIDDHLTTGIVIKAKLKTIPKIFETTGTTLKHIRTTRPRTVKPKGNLGKTTKKLRENKQKHTREVVKTTDAYNDDKDKEPVLIKLASDDSELKSVESYLSSTTKRHKSYKRTTRRKMTRRKHIYLKTTKKFRKAFRTTTFSEGLSIEHFGSLFGRDFHRKSNDNDSFVNTVLNSTLPSILGNVTLVNDVSEGLSKEMRRNNNISRDNDHSIQNLEEAKNLSENLEENIKDQRTVDENNDAITESIKIKGNIIIEKLNETTLNGIETTTSKPINNFTTYRNYNVSIVTKYFNIKPMKPTIILRRQDVDISNETDTKPATTEHTTLVQTENIITNASEINNTIIQTTRDGLENEIEDIMDRYNSTRIPNRFENYIKDVQMNADENKKVRDQMQADLARLLAPPSTKSTVTELFTDPFNDIDEAADIL